MIRVLDMDMGVIPMVLDMMKFGIGVDLPAFALLDRIMLESRDQVRARILDTVPYLPQDFNPGSPPQVTQLLFEGLGLPDKYGRNTNDKVLARLEDMHAVVGLVREWREYQKLLTSYVRAIPRLVHGDGRIHAQFQITRTDTGRLSCKSPNLMAQPVRSSEGRLIRDAYIAETGCSFASLDYSGIEMRVCAHVSQDQNMLGVFRRGEDLHAQTASMMFDLPVNQIDEQEHRYPAKRIGFGVLYGLTPEGLQREMSVAGIVWTLDRCEKAIESWFGVYSGVREYMDRTVHHARRYGYVRDMWGRVRLTPNVHSPNKHVRLEAERQACNAPIQMGAQGVIKTAMRNLTPVYRAMLGEGMIVRPIIQIHDDLVFEIGNDVLDDVLPLVRGVMEDVRGFSLPIEVDAKTGHRWGTMAKWKN